LTLGENGGNDSQDAKAEGDRRPTRPHDRYVAPEFAGYTRVFRIGHALLVPTQLNSSKQVLFLLDSGAFSSTISTRMGKQMGGLTYNPYLRVTGLNGQVKDVYDVENVVIQFGRFRQKNAGMPSFDLSNISHRLGTEISGTLGFTLLRMFDVKIDYRDDLVDFTYDAKEFPR